MDQLDVGEKIKQEAEELTVWFKINAYSALEDFVNKVCDDKSD